MSKSIRIKILLSGVVGLILVLFSCSKSGSGPDENGFNFPDSNLSFSQHIRPIFLADCATGGICHQTAVQAGGLDLETLSPTFLSNSANVVVPFNAQASLLYQLLFLDANGIPRMPLDRARLDDAKINAIGTWIDEGANTAN